MRGWGTVINSRNQTILVLTKDSWTARLVSLYLFRCVPQWKYIADFKFSYDNTFIVCGNTLPVQAMASDPTESDVLSGFNSRATVTRAIV